MVGERRGQSRGSDGSEQGGVESIHSHRRRRQQHQTDHRAGRAGLDELLTRVARGDEQAFAAVFDEVSAPAYGLAQRVVRDPAQAEEVAQDALVDVWRTATRYDPARGSALSWVMTIVHRRAVDRVRSEQADSAREIRAYHADAPFDEVSEAVVDRLQAERVRHCLDALTDLQRDAVQSAYYRGYTYREVAELLMVPLGTIKTRLRDALIRLRDCLGVDW